MSLEEAKYLLQQHQIVPNKLLGQNFMIDASVYPKLSSYANLNSNDVVLDAGAGFGFLTRFLSNKCKKVIAVEKDQQVAKVLAEKTTDLTNVTIVEGDVVRVEVPLFNKAISIPPYYLSSHLVLWLLDRGVEVAVLIVQKEFADRLAAKTGDENYSWLTVLTYQSSNAELLDIVPNWMFYPQPEVDSVILRLKPWPKPPFLVKDATFFMRLTKWLFTQRNKKLINAVVPFVRTEFRVDKSKAIEIAAQLPIQERRVRELTPIDFGSIANALYK